MGSLSGTQVETVAESNVAAQTTFKYTSEKQIVTLFHVNGMVSACDDVNPCLIGMGTATSENSNQTILLTE